MLPIGTAMPTANFTSFWWDLGVEFEDEAGFEVMFIGGGDVSGSEVELVAVVELMAVREADIVKFVVSGIAVTKGVGTTFSPPPEHDENPNKFTKSDSAISWNSALSVVDGFVREYGDVKVTGLPEEVTHCPFER